MRKKEVQVVGNNEKSTAQYFEGEQKKNPKTPEKTGKRHGTVKRTRAFERPKIRKKKRQRSGESKR